LELEGFRRFARIESGDKIHRLPREHLIVLGHIAASVQREEPSSCSYEDTGQQ